MRRVQMVVAATVLAGATLLAAPGGTARACACGGIVSPDLDARVTGEQGLVTFDGDVETIVMRLDVDSVADNAALVVPTPTPATATQADPAIFTELERLTAPRIEHHSGERPDLDEAGAAAGSAPTVVAQVQLGPLEATTLTGGDLTGVREWLDGNGYAMRPEVSAQLQPYLSQGWSLVAMRLMGDKPLDGQLDPIRLDFAAEEMVYPMRMSAAAKATQRVVIYTLAQHRMQRTDADAAHQNVTVDYAGTIAGRTSDTTLTELAAKNPYLTRISTTIAAPASITSDFAFGPAPTDDPYQRVIGRGPDDGDTGALLAAVAASGLVGVASAALGVYLVVRHRRRTLR